MIGLLPTRGVGVDEFSTAGVLGTGAGGTWVGFLHDLIRATLELRHRVNYLAARAIIGDLLVRHNADTLRR